MEYLTNDSALTNTADAIRSKGGTSSPILYDETLGFKSAIDALPTGGGQVNVKSGTLTVASDVKTAISTKITDITELGFTPKAFMLIRADAKATRYHLQQCTFATVGTTYYRTMTYRGSTSYTTSSNASSWTTQTAGHLYFNGGNVYIRTSTSYYLGAGTWHWVALTW